MIRFTDTAHSRRSFLRIGSLAMGGLSLPQLFALRAMGQDAAELVRDKSVVFLFLHGGPPQQEMFDPKMTAPEGVRSVTGEVRTTIPGVTFGSTLTRLARLANEMAVVRSFKTGNGDHDIKPIVCRETLGANIGSLYARVAGVTDPRNNMPRNVALFPRAVEPESQPAQTGFGRFDSAGALGSVYAPFVPGGGGTLEKDMTLSLPRKRLDDRRALLEHLDRIRRSIDAGEKIQGLDKFQEQAFDTILSGVAKAFDLSQEDPRTIARYDTAPLVRPDAISRSWNNYNYYVDNARTLGKLMLLARRLCEAGCRFVTVTTNFVWDFHADVNNATVEEGMRYVGVPFDHAVSAFLEDVRSRGLSEKILLVTCGEMGRTPKVNAKGGRDHWGNLAPLLLAGGGLNMGQVIGQSTRDAAEPATEPITNQHLLSTIMHTMFNVGELRVQRGMPVDVMQAMTTGEPIPGLM